MKTIGFPISHKENEHRRALLPMDLVNIPYKEYLFFETGYGDVCGYSDEDYISAGASITDRETVLSKDIICDPKVGDAEYLELLKNQTIFGWVHATQNKSITDVIISNQLTAYAWEKMYIKGRHLFWRNNELAGEAAVMHAFQCYARMPYEVSVAVLGKGNTSRGAVKVLNMLGADVTLYDRKTEELFRDEIANYDVIVNCVLWDVDRKDHIICKEDLKKMKKGSMIVDVSCDCNGGIETSVPTTIERPTYVVDGVLHYAVDHTPAIFHKTFSEINSRIIWPYINELVTGDMSSTLLESMIIQNGMIVDDEINRYQHR